MSYRQSATSGLLGGAGVATHGVDLDTDVAAGSLLVTAFFHRSGDGITSTPSGDDWTSLTPLDGDYGRLTVAWKVADGSEGDRIEWTHSPVNHEVCVQAIEYDGGTYEFVDWATLEDVGDDPVIPTADTTEDQLAVALLFNMQHPSQTPAVAGWTKREVSFISNGNRSRYETYEKVIDPAGTSVGGDTMTGTTDNTTRFMYGLATFTLDEGAPPPDPDPPDPSVPDWTPPEPGRAIVEIFVADPLGAKWDVAQWDVAAWSASAWTPIDHLVVSGDVVRGTDQGSLGVLAEPRAASWTLTTHDPDRELDPANGSSPFAGQIVPGLPIRIRHRETVIRQARVTRPEYSLANRGGNIRAADHIQDMANAGIPPDSDLPDTLYARARAAIAAAGLPITVLPDPPGGDPAIPTYAPGDSETVWAAILQAAQGVLWVPYIDRTNQLGFRAWSAALSRGRSMASDELQDVTSWVDYEGLYSGVLVLDDATDLVVERYITPTPAYGRRVHRAREAVPTLDAEAWAEAVLADRATIRARYRPGEIRPLDADSVEYHTTMELMEVVRLDVPEYGMDASVIILGDRLTVVDETRKDDVVRTRWRITYSTSEAPPAILHEDGDASVILTDESETYILVAG